MNLNARGAERKVNTIKVSNALSCKKISTTYHSVPAKGGLVCKGASTEAAHVGFLSGVNTLVPLQSIDLGELLLTVFTAVRTLTCQSKVKLHSQATTKLDSQVQKQIMCPNEHKQMCQGFIQSPVCIFKC